ncbi:phage holin family protein [Gramella sp. MAR_2010_147]|uniref:phage holin family protein n=1 Tax=Gramella sp. MAR_2010_147 TaxID=1250205 RepID=UPI00087BEF01|nr:phage holin family protein [Gramella sp. MAR_2010_147]SDS37642.1 Putative Holin-X, holin superfamily III [Gramella sp. MAR_2010_147]
MAFEKLSNSVQDLNNNIQSYIQSNSEYYRLRAFRQGMKGATALVRFLVMGFLLSTAGIMLSFAIAIVISQAIGVPSSGYFIVGGFYMIVFVLIFIFGKEPIEKLVLRKFSKSVFNPNDDE